jgi:hypothetical protein
MTFQELKQFIAENMRMSHIYQPISRIDSLKNEGSAAKTAYFLGIILGNNANIS